MVGFDVDEALVEAVVRSTNVGLQMTGVVPKPVGWSKFPLRSQEISVVIGMVGRSHGVLNFNVSRQVALQLASRLMDVKIEDVNEQVLDAMGEITNMVAGKLKAELGGEKYGIMSISCPSIIVGADYYLHHYKGFKTVTVEFELEELPTIFHRERVFATTLSLS